MLEWAATLRPTLFLVCWAATLKPTNLRIFPLLTGRGGWQPKLPRFFLRLVVVRLGLPKNCAMDALKKNWL